MDNLTADKSGRNLILLLTAAKTELPTAIAIYYKLLMFLAAFLQKLFKIQIGAKESLTPSKIREDGSKPT